MGFVMWLVWRTTNHTIPRLAMSFEQAVERQRQDFKEMIQQQRNDFERMMVREQEIHQEHVDRLVALVRDGGSNVSS